MRWATPWLLLLLGLIPLWWGWRRRRFIQKARLLPFSSRLLMKDHATGFWGWLARQDESLFTLVLVLLVLSLARPQERVSTTPVWDKGIDIVLVVDTSSSMLHQDFPPTRLHTARRLLRDIVDYRRQRTDRIGLVLFAREAYTLCPLTVDHQILKQMLSEVRTGVIPDDTALGDALTTALARLRHHTKQRKRAIILVTDGENNAGKVHPLMAAQLARAYGVKIFPLLVGKYELTSEQERGNKLITPWQVLEKVAKLSAGKAYRVTNQRGFQKALQQILDRLSPARLKKARYFSVYKERFSWFLWPALGLLCLGVLVQSTRLRSLS